MQNQEEDLSFLPFFLTEKIYLLPDEKDNTLATEAQKTDPTPKPNAGQTTNADAEQLIEAAPLNTMGKNKKGVLILFRDKTKETLSDPILKLLTKILQAVHLTTDDVAIYNWAQLADKDNHPGSNYELIQTIDCKKILVFGDLPDSWSLSHFFKRYQVTYDAEERGLLLSDELSIIAKDRDAKVKLWEGLQQMFH